MKKNIQLDYKQHYAKALATEDELKEIKAIDFLNYFGELIIKYSNQMENKMKSKREESCHGGQKKFY
ncbi:hypothetical protein SAMN05216232_0366 [Virgibacillus subterraneus]|uniref:Uncharacterized protein n=1 Tax=Virgibacillus subterraneus TaxID=621109 RepID=A0A1H8ZBB2_9BACI|nr:hypothetical protein [Virgibacillus subterraneus]SEP61739.1 hypothetical protein SAMN05216232_0366 [Virgibacillus subterraneus]